MLEFIFQIISEYKSNCKKSLEKKVKENIKNSCDS